MLVRASRKIIATHVQPAVSQRLICLTTLPFMPRTKEKSVGLSKQTALPFAPPVKTIDKGVPKRKYTTKTKGEKSSGLDPIARKNPEASTPDFSYNPDFLSADEQTALIEHLNQLPWQKVTYTKFGKPRSTPRHTFCFGTPSSDKKPVRVSYKGCLYMTEAMPDWLNQLKTKVEEATGFEYNAAILNNYMDAGEYISWHQDDEKFLRHTTVGSISLGASRTFKVRHAPKPGNNMTDEGAEEGESLSAKGGETAVSLVSGSLSVLYNGIEHCLPKQAPVPYKDMTNRYNITFRCLKPFQEGDKWSGWGNYYHYNRGSVYQTNPK